MSINEKIDSFEDGVSDLIGVAMESPFNRVVMGLGAFWAESTIPQPATTGEDYLNLGLVISGYYLCSTALVKWCARRREYEQPVEETVEPPVLFYDQEARRLP